MKDKTECSSFNLLAGKATFKDNEPLWYRILLMVIMAVFIVSLAFTIRLWVFPSLIGTQLSGFKWPDLLKLGKWVRSP